MISRLFSLIAHRDQLDALKLSEVLDWTGAVLNRVDRASFFSRFEESHAVQYFYEPFLQAFDPELRKQLGVWYTPPEIVKYMVERVDTVLRQELGLPLGLADKNVYVLDPCCGTGSYLIEVLDRIHRTLMERGEDGFTASDLKEAAQKRVFGFEILPAPFVVSHLQLGLLLQKLGVPLSEKSEDRVAVYLTNSLTGWEPPKGPKQHLIFKEMEEERDAAERVKRAVPILVILGNPPYNSFAGVSPQEEQGLVEAYKEGLVSDWGIKKFNLDDLYVRFFRLAERRITEGSPGRGVLCYISNFSYLSDSSFVAMRRRFLREFDRLWFDCMNGDSRETGKLTPEGRPDPSVFSTEYNREGIRVGTAIGLMVRRESRAEEPGVRFRQFWGSTKRADLLSSITAEGFDSQYELVQPGPEAKYSFAPSSSSAEYTRWPRIGELGARPPINGLMEKRDGALIGIDRVALSERMEEYYDPKVEWESLRPSGLTRNAARFDARKARAKVLRLELFNPERLRHYALRPFDVRWCYYSPVRPLWNEPRPALFPQCWPGNAFLMSRPAGVSSPEGTPFFYTSLLGDNDFLRGHAYYFPLGLRSASPKHGAKEQETLIQSDSGPSANLSGPSRSYLSSIGLDKPDNGRETAALVWMHVLATGYAPAYLSENADGIRQDWPRIPLPDSKELLLASAALGRKIAALARHGDAV
jgi:predicted helicase